jgi:hypothetical protein
VAAHQVPVLFPVAAKFSQRKGQGFRRKQELVPGGNIAISDGKHSRVALVT